MGSQRYTCLLRPADEQLQVADVVRINVRESFQDFSLSIELHRLSEQSKHHAVGQDLVDYCEAQVLSTLYRREIVFALQLHQARRT